MEVQDNKLTCEECGRSFSKLLHLSNHRKSHLERTRYKCSHCDHSTFRKDHLENHINIHKNHKPYVCDQCTFRTTQLVNLYKHKQTHLNNEEKFSCSICNKCFNLKSYLQMHLARHTKKESICKICKLSFVNRRLLKKHNYNSHSNKENAIMCTICDKMVTNKSNYKKHIATHTGEELFTCEICNEVFTRKDNLKRHLVCVHKKDTLPKLLL